MESDYVRADMVEITEFPQLAKQYKVSAVPRTVINEKVSFTGPLPESGFLARVLEAQE